MAFYQYYKEQIVPAGKAQVWDFISSPANLKKITPPEMGFDITTAHVSEKMYAGMIISYKVRPLPGFKTDWVTEITQVVDGKYFVDEQRVGPYSIWHHQHILEDHPKGVLMKDLITYAPPFGFLGAIANSVLIKGQLNKIFDFRKQAIEELFGKID
jgi:ligand-binding SRPBCC domain-containing protein